MSLPIKIGAQRPEEIVVIGQVISGFGAESL